MKMYSSYILSNFDDLQKVHYVHGHSLTDKSETDEPGIFLGYLFLHGIAFHLSFVSALSSQSVSLDSPDTFLGP